MFFFLFLYVIVNWDRVIARWTDNHYYSGKVDSIELDKITVLFDDGDEISHSIEDISAVFPDQEPSQLRIGQHVVAVRYTWEGGREYHKGYVSDKNSDRFKVTFDDNYEDFYLAKELRIFPDHNSAHSGECVRAWNFSQQMRGTYQQ